MSTCADVGSVIESKMYVVQTSNVGFTSEVSDYLVVHTGPGLYVLSSSSAFLSISMGLTNFGETFAYVTVLDPAIEVVTF